MRALPIMLAACLAALSPARAGDVATWEVLGFSADGGMFAFEEYGVQDGSGFPYANRFYIDTAGDTFLPGTPVRVLLEDEAATVDAARAAAAERGALVAGDAELGANPGFAAGRNQVTEFSADPFVMRVGPRPVFPAIDDDLEFRLSLVDAKGPAMCDGLAEVKGFRLERLREGGLADIVHEDASVPSSRGCPQSYSIAGVQTFFPEAGDPVYAVIVAIRRLGFEGPDFRFLAVTGKM